MNVYDKVEEDPLPLRAEGKKRLRAFMPGYHTAEKNALEAWEVKLEALLAAELP